ncbi:histone deacetylase complex subunit SAP25 [Ctenodactylus gundi]
MLPWPRAQARRRLLRKRAATEVVTRVRPAALEGKPQESQEGPRRTVPLSPQIAWEVAPSRMTVLSSWDPSDEAKIRPQLVQGATCGAGTSFSCRTLYHPSFWPMYDASGGSLRPLTPNPGCQNGQQAPGDAGLPVMCSEDVFLLDPLLPPGQRIPLHLSEAPQQAMGPLRLLLPPPIMAPSACSPQPQACRTAWLSGAELIALTGLLQMSQGEPRPDSTPAGCTDSASDH